MNLKRIIREEMDDVWQHLTQGEPNIWISYQMLVFDEEPTKEEVINFIKDAFKSGLVRNDAIRTWELEGIEDEAETIYEYSQKGAQPYLRIDLNNGWLYYGEYYSNIKNESSELRTIKYSEIKNYLMRESEEEEDVWRWAKETNIDLPKTEEDLKNFIGWSFIWDTDREKHSGKWGYNGRSWTIINIKDIDIIYRDQSTNNYEMEISDFLRSVNSGAYALVSPEGILLDPIYNRTYDKRLNESTGLEWINDIVPENTDDFKVGDIIRIVNVSNEESFLSWLGDYSNSYRLGDYGDNIMGKVIEITEDSFVLEEFKTKDKIYFPKYRKMEMLRQGLHDTSAFGEYKGLNMIYELLNITY